MRFSSPPDTIIINTTFSFAWSLKGPFFPSLPSIVGRRSVGLTAESVQSAALSLEGVDDVHGGDRLSLGVLRVGDGVTNDVL